MPPPLPERYRLEVRIGRDDDIEEWLATDDQLDRPVLVRVLGPESRPERRAGFAAATKAAAAVTHPNVARVYEVATIPDGAYSVSEWPGGIRLADRSTAGLAPDPSALLANAEALAHGLAALHLAGVVHGAIDAGAVFFSAARPAKLGAFGRPARTTAPEDDVRALANVLEEAITGRPARSVPPSEVVDGLSPLLDEVFEELDHRHLTAETLAERLGSVPSPSVQEPAAPSGRRWGLMALGLGVAATLLVLLGTRFAPDSVVVPDGTSGPGISGGSATVIGRVRSFDPFGDGTENDRMLPNLVDGDENTAWTTESYIDPLPLIKAGVGVVIEVSGTPSTMVVEGVPRGSAFDLRWGPTGGSELGSFEILQRVVADGGPLLLVLPERVDGGWLVWFTELPADGRFHRTSISGVSFP